MTLDEYNRIFAEFCKVCLALEKYYQCIMLRMDMHDHESYLSDYNNSQDYAMEYKHDLLYLLEDAIETTDTYLVEFIECVRNCPIPLNELYITRLFASALRNKDEVSQAYLTMSGYYDGHRDMLAILEYIKQ